MISREASDGFVLIRQHDHGLVSGEFAKHFSPEWVGSPSEEALFAVSKHDIGWEMLDREVLWNDETDRPYSFLDYPPAPKMEAYTRGLDEVEAESPYAALLCSTHYGLFVKESSDPDEIDFREREERRRERLRDLLPDEKMEDFDRDLRLVRVCDSLSLFVCLNEPGKGEHPWYADGFTFGDERLRPVWKSAEVLGFDPFPFREEFEVAVPYRVFGRDRREKEPGSYRIVVSP